MVLLVAAWLMRKHLGWTLLFLPLVITGLLVAGWGDLMVARSIWQVPGDNTQAFQATDPAAFERGHDLDELGGTIMFWAGLAFVASVGLTRRVTSSAAMFAALLALAPPWMLGGFGAWWVIARIQSEQLRNQLSENGG